MRVIYDSQHDVLMMIMNNNEVEESNEVKTGIIMHTDRGETLVSIEIYDASSRIDNPRSVEYTVIP